MNKKIKFTAVLMSLSILVLILYFSVFAADYVWDDTLLFVNKTGLLEQPLSWSLISSPVLPNTSYFRPLVFLSWYIEFQLWGINPFVSHIIGLIVFTLNNFLLFSLAYTLAQRKNNNNPFLFATLATLLYLTHPALIESTVWVSGRFDQLCTLFILSSLLIFCRNFKNSQTPISRIAILVLGLCFMAALLSKELAIVTPILLMCFYFMLESKKSYQILIKDIFSYQYKLLAVLCLVFLIYFMMRFQALQNAYNLNLSQNYIYYYVIKQLLPLYAVEYYFLHIFLPFNHVSLLSPLEEIDHSIFGTIKALFSLLLMVGILYLAFVKRYLTAWLGVCAIISLFLVLYIFPISLAGNLGHDRFLTLPLAFVALAIVFLPYEKIASVLKISFAKLRLLLSLVFTFWLILSIATVKNVAPFWSNEYSLWYLAYKTHPDSDYARNSFLYAALKEKQFDEIIDISQKYIKKEGALEVADQVIYATALMNKNDPESVDYYEGAISALPKFHEDKDPRARKKADYFLMSAAQLSDSYALYALSLIRFKGDIQGALRNLKIAEWYLMDDQKETLNYYLAGALYANGQYDEALHLYRQQKVKTLKLGKTNYIYTPGILGQYCSEKGKTAEACARFTSEPVFKEMM